MMGRCYPVATSLNEIAAIGGYLNISGGTALKNLYTTPTKILDMDHTTHTLTLDINHDSASTTLADLLGTDSSPGGSPRGQINVYTSKTGSSSYDLCNNWLNYCWLSSRTVTVKRDKEGISGSSYGNHTDMKITFNEIYYS